MKEIFPKNLFDCQNSKNLAPVATFDIELFLKRHNLISHFDDKKSNFDMDFTDELEYCGRFDFFRLFKIPFGKNNNDLIFLVDSDNFISKIVLKINFSDYASLEGMINLILRNLEIKIEKFLEMKNMLAGEKDLIFYWFAENKKFIFVKRLVIEKIVFIGFFAEFSEV